MSHIKSSNSSSGHNVIPLELQNSCQVNSHSHILLKHSPSTVAWRRPRRKHVSSVRLRVHWSITSTGHGTDNTENIASSIVGVGPCLQSCCLATYWSNSLHWSHLKAVHPKQLIGALSALLFWVLCLVSSHLPSSCSFYYAVTILRPLPPLPPYGCSSQAALWYGASQSRYTTIINLRFLWILYTTSFIRVATLYGSSHPGLKLGQYSHTLLPLW
jgi:hypothetical protein